MKRITRKVKRNDIWLREDENMKKKLNLSFAKLTNRACCSENNELPEIRCNTNVYPDYIALYTEPEKYNFTNQTAVSFYCYDDEFDGIHGLFNAIYFDDKNLLKKYKERFENVKYFISPDNSFFSDMHSPEKHYRLWKARIVSLWFSLELKAVVIPNITYGDRKDFDICFEGLEQSSVVAFSTKGYMRKEEDRELLRSAIQYAVDHLPLKAIVVYTVSGNRKNVLNLFRYAAQKGIKIIVPDNTLLDRNSLRVQNGAR